MRYVNLDTPQIDALRRVGYWWSADYPELPHPRDLIDMSWDAAERERVITYLGKQCYTLTRFSPGYADCRLGCPLTAELGNGERTDGVWVFPEGLLHYVRRHMVKLPEEFLNHMRTMNFSVPKHHAEVMKAE